MIWPILKLLTSQTGPCTPHWGPTFAVKIAIFLDFESINLWRRERSESFKNHSSVFQCCRAHFAMATLHHLPIFHSLSSPKLSSSSHFQSPYSRINSYLNFRHSTVASSSLNRPLRASKKPKSDEDLRNDIKDFLSSVGLPETHVPTTKELLLYGRKDLANIVRRRGYKFIRQLLEISSTPNFIESNVETSQTGSKEEDINRYIGANDELQIDDQYSVAAESLSMQEKVARFIQLGELDETEDGALGMTKEKYADEEGKKTRLEHSNEPEFALSMSNGNVSPSALKVEDPALENTAIRNSYISTNQHTDNSGDDLNDEEHKVETSADIMHLRYLLYQKELELTQLREQIEKEKLALSLLHSKAEKEISRAEELVSEKETELDEAEEAFSGLKEVEILYSADGETVELAGSFNGWLHRIPMSPQSSSSIVEPTGFSTSQVWRAVLWLYPGVYEIKFVVDGDWRIDPEMESITRYDVHNNVLRVE